MRERKNMSYYCSFGAVQAELRSYYHSTGRKLQFNEAIDQLYNKGLLAESLPEFHPPLTLELADMDRYEEFIDQIYFPIPPNQDLTRKVSETDMIPRINDVYIIRHPRYTRPYMHRHDYVEIDFVARGSCTMYFEEETKTLEEDSLCLISPTSYHDIEIDDESTVYCIMLRRSTFQSSFFSLMDRDDVLSAFFRTMLTDMQNSNYMIFRTEDPAFIRIMLQNAMYECHYPDQYSNNCCRSLINLLFANMLRKSSEMPEVYHHNMGSDFSAVIHYIRRNFRTITLTSLAEEFHYSKPHLCTLIKKNTGIGFSELIRQVRVKEATEYLTKTDIPISDIAYLVGYNSADNFSRVFRKFYGISPIEYRRTRSSDDDKFIPFSNI